MFQVCSLGLSFWEQRLSRARSFHGGLQKHETAETHDISQGVTPSNTPLATVSPLVSSTLIGWALGTASHPSEPWQGQEEKEEL